MKNIAIIPARSGSKGLKDKNIKELNGKPLIAYSIEAALKSGVFDRVHLSTDSEQYAEIGRMYGADVPFLRREDLSSDVAGTWDVVKYVVNEYEKLGEQFDTLSVLQPTSPLRTAEDISRAYDFFVFKNANMVSSVCEMEHSPLWSNTLPEDLSMTNFEDEEVTFAPRQTLPKYYRECGAIYIVRKEHLLQSKNIYKDRCYAFIMEQSHAIDIDSAIDFKIAEVLMNEG